jgi:hypothetical protein
MSRKSSAMQSRQTVPWALTSDTDVYFGRGETILAERRRIKLQTIQNRRLNHQRQAA